MTASQGAGNSTTAIENYFPDQGRPITSTTLDVELTQTAGGKATGSAMVLYDAALH